MKIEVTKIIYHKTVRDKNYSYSFHLKHILIPCQDPQKFYPTQYYVWIPYDSNCKLANSFEFFLIVLSHLQLNRSRCCFSSCTGRPLAKSKICLSMFQIPQYTTKWVSKFSVFCNSFHNIFPNLPPPASPKNNVIHFRHLLKQHPISEYQFLSHFLLVV